MFLLWLFDQFVTRYITINTVSAPFQGQCGQKVKFDSFFGRSDTSIPLPKVRKFSPLSWGQRQSLLISRTAERCEVLASGRNGVVQRRRLVHACQRCYSSSRACRDLNRGNARELVTGLAEDVLGHEGADAFSFQKKSEVCIHFY